MNFKPRTPHSTLFTLNPEPPTPTFRAMQVTISALHSSARGSQLFARGVLTYAVRHGYLQASAVDEKGRFFNVVVFALGCVGFWSQFMSGFVLPFPLNILLLPARFAEWSLRALVFLLG